jgi:hypothetical protein
MDQIPETVSRLKPGTHYVLFGRNGHPVPVIALRGVIRKGKFKPLRYYEKDTRVYGEPLEMHTR